MGIPKFHGQWIRTRPYRGLLSRQLPSSICSFSLDLNSLFHACAQKVYAYGNGANPDRLKVVAKTNPIQLEFELFNLISTELMALTTKVSPQQVLCLAVDGVAPVAKINQQRQRRYRASQTPSSPYFNSNLITPGTEFMQRLDKFLQQWIENSRSHLPPIVIYSSYLVPGEGEHKIIDFMRSGVIPPGPGAHILYGLDADLYMLALMAPYDNIYLMREGNNDYPSISALKAGINEELGTFQGYLDFVLMCFLVGNDFLPAAPSLEEVGDSVTFLMDLYKRIKKEDYKFTGFIKDKNIIDWKNFSRYLTALAQEEQRLLNKVAEKVFRYPSPIFTKSIIERQRAGEPVKRILDYKQFQGLWYYYALGPRGDTKLASKLIAPETFAITQEGLQEMILNYLSGIAWTFSYYRRGPTTISNTYLYRYHYAPLFQQIAEVVSSFNPELHLEPYLLQEEEYRFGIAEQLLSILPPKDQKLLPIPLQVLMNSNSPLADLFPLQFIVEGANKDEEHQNLVILPPLEAERIVKTVEAIGFSIPEGANIISRQEEKITRLLKPRREGGRGRGMKAPSLPPPPPVKGSYSSKVMLM